jgi:hypothetical protein
MTLDRRSLLAVARAAFAILGLVAVLTQLTDLANRGVLVPFNFFSYFTIDSNLITIAVLLIGAARWRSARSATFELVRGEAVLCMTVTFLVFAVLLSNTDVDTAIPWVNSVVHEILPIVIVLDWLIDPPVDALTFRRGLWLLAFPIAWLVYTLIRGPLAGWYPYPFLDPANGGYGTVALYSLAIAVLGVVLVGLVVWLAGVMRPRRFVPPAR